MNADHPQRAIDPGSPQRFASGTGPPVDRTVPIVSTVPDPTDVPVEVIVAFVEDEGYYPRARGKDPALDYWRAIAVMAKTLRTVGADWTVTVSTNKPPADPTVRRLLDSVGVGFRDTKFEHRPPPDYFDRFSGSFYLLDALVDAVTQAPPGSILVQVDPDCVWVRDPEPLIRAVQSDPKLVLAYEITYASGQPAHQLTQEELGYFFREVSGRDGPPRPAYAGGEFLLGYRDRLAELLPHMEDIWQESMTRFSQGLRVKANTEEHALSYALGQIGWTGGTANSDVRRLWTYPPPHGSVQGDETDLICWHVLSEKDRGLPRLFKDFEADHPALRVPGPSYRAHLARRLNVEPPPIRRLYNWAYPYQYRLRRRKRAWPVEW